MRSIFANGRYANVTATMALIVALGGTAYAAGTIRSRDIVNGGVKRADLAANAVNSAKVKDRSLRAQDFAANQIPAGPKGDKGDQGDKGDRGPSNAFARYTNGPVILPFTAGGKADIVTLDLPAGTFVVHAKAWVQNTAGIGTTNVECDLALPSGDFDRGRVGLEDTNKSPVSSGTMALEVTGTLGAAGTAALRCVNDGSGQTRLHFVKVSAIQVASLSNSPMP